MVFKNNINQIKAVHRLIVYLYKLAKNWYHMDSLSYNFMYFELTNVLINTSILKYILYSIFSQINYIKIVFSMLN